MPTENEWKLIKDKWIAEGKIPDDEGHYHVTLQNEASKERE